MYGTRAPSQAWGIVEALNVLEACVPTWYPGQTLASLGPANPLYWHALDRDEEGRLPRRLRPQRRPERRARAARDADVESARGVAMRQGESRARVSDRIAERRRTGAGDTIYLATADRWGNMVSWINSNFSGWGSGHHGAGLRIHPAQPRRAVHARSEEPERHRAGNKRPYNTLSAVLVMQNDRPLLVTGQHGGDQQGQGNMQVLVNILDLGANVQAAGDMARFSHNQVSNKLQMESRCSSWSARS